MRGTRTTSTPRTRHRASCLVLAFYFAFTLFPFLFHRQFAKSAVPWATAALAGPLHFYLVLDVVRAGWPSLSGMMGLLPAAFSIPALLGVILLLKNTPVDSPARNAQLAWFGGIALFFITLIFPIQFEREWITIGWALEGAALCWLLHRVPHRGLGLAGVGLLLAAFARLALNPAVLDYHARSGVPVLNWYLYAYGITIALFVCRRIPACASAQHRARHQCSAGALRPGHRAFVPAREHRDRRFLHSPRRAIAHV